MTVVKRECVLTWSDSESARAPDGTEYGIFSEHVRGEPRFYEFKIRPPGLGWTGVPDLPGRPLREFDGSNNIRTVRNRAERHAREFHG